ncbi:MAG: hypothetical protein JO209_04950 [Acidisphaera sp.]|nr:hypothetical protein [Acidisphaera sp.]
MSGRSPRRLLAVIAAVALLGGCAVYPGSPYYGGYYAPGYTYAYAGPPVVVGVGGGCCWGGWHGGGWGGWRGGGWGRWR